MRPVNLSDELALLQRSRHLHGRWYVETYPDVQLTGLPPAAHYLKYGALLGRNPGKNFDTGFYRRTYLGDDGDAVNPLIHYETNRDQRDRPTHGRMRVAEIQRIARMLWAGMAEAAEPKLEAVCADPGQPPQVRVRAMIELARWLNFTGDEARALDLLERGARDVTGFGAFRGSHLKLGFMRARAGDTRAARSAFLQMPETECDDRALALSTTFASDILRLHYINAVFRRSGLAPLARRDPDRPLGLDNLVAAEPMSCDFDIGLVSVIMPAYLSEETIATAVGGLQAQSYRNLEIIVVDDCSPDGTGAVVERLAAADPRVRLVRMPQNGGAYPARNRGLEEARGEFLTTHDADDWSHPEKIERQLRAMHDDPGLMGVSTHWVRCRPDLRFTYNWRLGDWLVHWSHSSFLFRRQVYEDLGGWDNVRVSGDTEFIWRVEHRYGEKATAKLHPSVALAFSLDDETSLTRTKVTHVSTTYFGLRQYYRAVSRYWLDRAPAGLSAAQKALKQRMLPPEIISRDAPPPELDLLIRVDFRVAERVERAASLIRPDQSVGLVHRPDPAADARQGGDGREFALPLFDLLMRDNVRAVLPGSVGEGVFGRIVDI